MRAVTKYLNHKHVVALLVTHFDHVAEYGKAHYQVVGLKDMDESKVENEIQNAGMQKGVAVIASHMNYGLYRVLRMREIVRGCVPDLSLTGIAKRCDEFTG